MLLPLTRWEVEAIEKNPEAKKQIKEVAMLRDKNAGDYIMVDL